MINYLYMGLLFLGVILLYYAYQQYTKTTKLMSHGVKTTATVTDLIQVYSDDGDYTYKAVFEFVDRNEISYQLTSNVSSNPPMYKLGERVKVIYNAKDPEEVKVVSFWGLYAWSVVLSCVACPLIIIGGGYLMYVKGL
jgi:hypothetical protein